MPALIHFEMQAAGPDPINCSNSPPIDSDLVTHFDKMLRLEHPDIIFVQSIKDYLIIKTTQGDHITHMTMKSIVDLLPNASFRRVHRSYLVGISHFTAIGRNELILAIRHLITHLPPNWIDRCAYDKTSSEDSDKKRPRWHK
jgi:hypothetical protein